MVRATITALLAMAVMACSPGREDTPPPPSDPPAPGPGGTVATIPPATVGEISPAGPRSRPDTQPEEDAMGCDASKAEWMIGEEYSDELLERGAADAGAETARFLRPGQMVTMEYNATRLNADLDEDDRVISVRCG